MPIVREERNNEASRAFAREHMGRGIGTIFKPPSEWLETKPPDQQDQSHLVPDSPSGTDQMIEQEATEQMSGEYQPEATADQCEQSDEVNGPRS